MTEPQDTTESQKPHSVSASELNALLCCVLTRGIPIDGPMVDTVTHICAEGETVADLWKWVEEQTKGSAWIVKVEITKAT